MHNGPVAKSRVPWLSRRVFLIAAIAIALLVAGYGVWTATGSNHTGEHLQRSITPKGGVLPQLLPDGAPLPGSQGAGTYPMASSAASPGVILIPSAGGPVYARGGYVTVEP